MDSTVPADLLKFKNRLEAWRAIRRYARQPIPAEFRHSAAEMAGRYSPSLVRSVLKLDPWRLKKPSTKKPVVEPTVTSRSRPGANIPTHRTHNCEDPYQVSTLNVCKPHTFPESSFPSK